MTQHPEHLSPYRNRSVSHTDCIPYWHHTRTACNDLLWVKKNDPSFCPRSCRTKSSFPRTCKHALHTSVKRVHVCSFIKMNLGEKGEKSAFLSGGKHKCFLTAGEEKNRAAAIYQNKNIMGWKRFLLLFHEPCGWFCQLFVCFSKLNFFDCCTFSGLLWGICSYGSFL